MSNRIMVLPETVVSKIAAGEVIERPASVVKELLENSIDAGAHRIVIDIEEGGKKLIRVCDDGKGMGWEDARLCFERYATSKIHNEEDLFCIATLGFRGEALPSIAAVSRTTLITKLRDDTVGAKVYNEGGVIKDITPWSSAEGTVVEVSNLFFNTPVRSKFLRSPSTELTHIIEQTYRQALGQPDIGFSLSHNYKNIYNFTPARDYPTRVADLFGPELIRQLYPLHYAQGPLQIEGLISPPTLTCSDTRSIYIFLNHRFIRDRIINHAIHQAYRDIIPKGRHPMVFLYLRLVPSLVDVNVHPTKIEVRFKHSDQIHSAVEGTLRNTLKGGLKAPEIEHHYTLRAAKLPSEVREGSLPFYDRTPVNSTKIDQTTPLTESGWQILGQHQRTFIICSSAEELIVIDQHAAHERIIYERLKQEVNRGGIEVQKLLFPTTLELSHHQAQILENHTLILQKSGLEIENYGGRTFILKSIPALLKGTDPHPLILDLIDELQGPEGGRRGDNLLDGVLKRMACHGAVRAGEILSRVEMEEISDQIASGVHFSSCPHGRPIILRFGREELERNFKRR